MTSHISSVKFGFYRIAPEILKSLKEINDSVSDSVYIGPLMTVESKRGSIPLFAPLSAEFNENETVMQALKSNRYAGIDFNTMIPIVNTASLIDAESEISDDKKDFYIKSCDALKKFAKGAYERQ